MVDLPTRLHTAKADERLTAFLAAGALHLHPAADLAEELEVEAYVAKAVQISGGLDIAIFAAIKPQVPQDFVSISAEMYDETTSRSVRAGECSNIASPVTEARIPTNYNFLPKFSLAGGKALCACHDRREAHERRSLLVRFIVGRPGGKSWIEVFCQLKGGQARSADTTTTALFLWLNGRSADLGSPRPKNSSAAS